MVEKKADGLVPLNMIFSGIFFLSLLDIFLPFSPMYGHTRYGTFFSSFLVSATLSVADMLLTCIRHHLFNILLAPLYHCWWITVDILEEVSYKIDFINEISFIEADQISPSQHAVDRSYFLGLVLFPIPP